MSASTTSRWFAVVLVLQMLILAGLWLGVSGSSVAYAQPDAGRDRKELLEEVRKTNAKLDTLIELLRSGKLQVQAAQADQPKPAGDR